VSAVLVDTDIVSMVFKGDSRAERYRRYLTGNILAVSFMTVAELHRWALSRNWGAPRRAEMKDLLNKVTEAKKAAEANLISRREETAAMRSQANTAKLLADNPTLMRLRELEVLEKIASAGHLNVVLGEKGLAERVVNLL